VASISWDEAAPYLSDDQKDRLRQVVLASQAMENTPIFRLLPPEQKEVWIAKGTPVVYSPGEIIMEEGEKQRWIGLVVTGKVSVYKQGKELAQLSPREVIGEMAYLTGEPRAATLVAQAPVLVWRWEPHWLDTTLGRTPLHLALEDLARSRRNGHETR
jgi:CRP-like cAMP-binding protein